MIEILSVITALCLIFCHEDITHTISDHPELENGFNFRHAMFIHLYYSNNCVPGDKKTSHKANKVIVNSMKLHFTELPISKMAAYLGSPLYMSHSIVPSSDK